MSVGRLLPFLLVAFLMAALAAGCSSSDDEAAETGGAPAAATDADAGTEAAAAEVRAKFAEARGPLGRTLDSASEHSGFGGTHLRWSTAAIDAAAGGVTWGAARRLGTVVVTRAPSRATPANR